MATIVIGSQQVIAAAMKVIASIEDERANRDEACISRMMGTNRGWFKKFYPNRDMAIKLLDATSDFRGWRSMYAYGDLYHAKALLRLAQHGDTVTLNEEDVRVLF